MEYIRNFFDRKKETIPTKRIAFYTSISYHNLGASKSIIINVSATRVQCNKPSGLLALFSQIKPLILLDNDSATLKLVFGQLNTSITNSQDDDTSYHYVNEIYHDLIKRYSFVKFTLTLTSKDGIIPTQKPQDFRYYKLHLQDGEGEESDVLCVDITLCNDTQSVLEGYKYVPTL